MIKTIHLSLLLLVLSTSSLFAQFGGPSKVVLPQLALKSKSMEIVLGDIDTFIGNKPNGLQFPVSKIVFSKLEDLLCYHIVAIDNSWTHLFKYGEVPYGFVVVQNRLFMVVGEGYHDMNLNAFFSVTDYTKTFSKTVLQPTGIKGNPTWFFEYRNGQSYLISVEDLELMN